MMRKKRGYERDVLQPMVRDWRLFAIACEGSKREPAYFNLFSEIGRRIQVDIIEEKVSDESMQQISGVKSSPNWVLDRAIAYIDQEKLNDEDELWFVIDLDHWKPEQIELVVAYCVATKNRYIALSNPSFEVWLCYHKRRDLAGSVSITAQDFKKELDGLEAGGFHPYTFIGDVPHAINNARAADSNPRHHLPQHKETKVYILAERLLSFIGLPAFNEFIADRLPVLLSEEYKRRVKKK